MAQVQKRKARKDYPHYGIKKGDEHYWVRIKTGQRSSKEMRSLTPFKPSQLTTSPFKSGWYAAQEQWEASDLSPDAAREAAATIQELGDEAQSSFDNMPEGFQQGATGQTLENRIAHCEETVDQIEQLADEYENREPDDSHPDEEDEAEEAHDAFQTEVSNLLDDMPE